MNRLIEINKELSDIPDPRLRNIYLQKNQKCLYS